jgi:hypothetical protein
MPDADFAQLLALALLVIVLALQSVSAPNRVPRREPPA